MTYNEILPNLFLGDMEDAIRFPEDHKDGHLICVLEHRPPHEPMQSIHVPVLTSSGHVHSTQLDKVACIIDAIRKDGKPLLVHCAAGIERSPLTVAWYLKWAGFAKDMHEAYLYVKHRRPQVADRQVWLVIDE